jgi:chemotaxis signal transduction protein
MQVLAFRSNDQRYVVRLDAVHTVVRLRRLRRLPGSAGALAGVLHVQDTPVAVYETRTTPAQSGDVLVLSAGWPGHAIGVACDHVEELLEVDELREAAADRPSRLPAYVEAMLLVHDSLVPLVDAVGLAAASAGEPSPHDQTLHDQTLHDQT